MVRLRRQSSETRIFARGATLITNTVGIVLLKNSPLLESLLVGCDSNSNVADLANTRFPAGDGAHIETDLNV